MEPILAAAGMDVKVHITTGRGDATALISGLHPHDFDGLVGVGECGYEGVHVGWRVGG